MPTQQVAQDHEPCDNSTGSYEAGLEDGIKIALITADWMDGKPGDDARRNIARLREYYRRKFALKAGSQT